MTHLFLSSNGIAFTCISSRLAFRISRPLHFKMQVTVFSIFLIEDKFVFLKRDCKSLPQYSVHAGRPPRFFFQVFSKHLPASTKLSITSCLIAFPVETCYRYLHSSPSPLTYILQNGRSSPRASSAIKISHWHRWL